MTPTPAIRPGPEAGKAIMKKHNISGAQIEVLRNAARKWKNYYNDKEGLHDGQITTYNVHTSTISILTERGLIVKTHLYDAQDRANRALRSKQIADKAFRVAISYDPFDMIQLDGSDGDDTPAWRVVADRLEEVRKIVHGNTIEVFRITDAGREIINEFKLAIGATEE